MASFAHSYEVCTCNHVSLGEIVHAIEEQNATSIKDIGDLTDAGTGCGHCKSAKDDFSDNKRELYINQILEKCKTNG